MGKGTNKCKGMAGIDGDTTKKGQVPTWVLAAGGPQVQQHTAERTV